MKELKTPWTDTKIVLYRASGEVVALDAKSAIYAVGSTKVSTNQHKPFEVPAIAFIDPATRDVWIGWGRDGNVETNVFAKAGQTASTNYLTYTNLFIETGSEIINGDSLIHDERFEWQESVIKQAQPGESLDAMISRVATGASSAWFFEPTFGATSLGKYFQPGFFFSGNLGSQTISIQYIAVSNGKLRLDFNSLEYQTTGSVWLDLKTFEVRKVVAAYRPVRFNFENFFLGIVPALLAFITATVTLLLTRKARSVTHVIMSVVVLTCIGWSWFMMYRIYVFGVWPTHLSFFQPILAIGDRAVYLPVLGIAIATVMTAAQAILARFEKQK